MKSQDTYFVVPPVLVGRTPSVLFGQTTIPEAVASWLDINGYGKVGVDYTLTQLLSLTNEIRSYCSENNEPTETTMKLLAEHLIKGKSVERKIRLDNFELFTTPNGVRLIVTLIEDDNIKKGVGNGYSIVDAIVTGVKHTLGIPEATLKCCKIEELRNDSQQVLGIFGDVSLNTEENRILQSLIEKKDKPQVKSYVEITCNNKVFQGINSSHNILHSILMAVVDAFDAMYRLNS